VAFPRDIVLVEQGGGSAETVYVVRVADTLEEIAQAFDVSLISLVEYNDIVDTRTVLVGDILVIPPGAPAYGLVPPLPGQVTESGGGGNDIIYVIQPRDTLDTVGAFYNAEPRCIAAANGIINTRTIQPRTTILIPEVCAPYVGPNVAGGRLIPIEGEPTIAATVLLSSTPRPTLAPSATFPAPEGTATVATRVSTVVATPTVESLGAGGGAESTATSTLAASATATNTRPPSVTPTSTIVATVAVTSTRPPSTATIIPTPTIEILVTATP
jgi:LysM repeat protein